MCKTSSNQVHVMHWSICARRSAPFGLGFCVSVPWLWFWNLDRVCWTPDPTCGISVTPVHCFACMMPYWYLNYMVPYMTSSVLTNWWYDLHFPGVCHCKLAATTREKLQDYCSSVQVNALAIAFEKSSDLPRFSVLLQKTGICTVPQDVDFWLLVIWGQREGKRATLPTFATVWLARQIACFIHECCLLRAHSIARQHIAREFLCLCA